MDKVLEILEEYCQWLAVAVGGLFLGWTLWAYVLMTPVSVGGLTPGTVDEKTYVESARPLEERIKGPAATPPSAQLSDPSKEWQKVIRGEDKPAVALANNWVSSIPGTKAKRPEEEVQAKKVEITALPVLPPAEMLPGESIKSARVLIAPPADANGNPAPAVVPAAGAVPAGAKDLSYIRGEYRISLQELAGAFNQGKVPPTSRFTSIIGISVMRQERLPDGSWSKEIEITPVNYGITVKKIPADDSAPETITEFKTWAESTQGQTELLRPIFFPMLSGEGPWDAPLAKVVADPEADRLAKLKEARDAADARAKERAEKARGATPAPRQGPGGGAGRPGVGTGGAGRNADPGYAPQDNDRPQSLSDLAGMQLAQADTRLGGRPRAMPGEENMQPPTPANPAQVTGAAPPEFGPVPDKAFDPGDANLPFTSITSWFIDTSVVEGHTYRYQVRYAITNPLYLDSAMKDPKLQKQLAIWSPLSDKAWSEEREVESSTRYYLANNPWFENSPITSVKFEVFKWANGKWQSKAFNVSIGDRIGGQDGAVDFSTNAVLVDIRYDKFESPNRPYILVLAADGRLATREPTADKNDPDRLNLTETIKAATPPTGAAAPGGATGGT